MMDIGSQLRAAREAQGLTLEQAFKGTRIKVSFLEAIEANQFDALPGQVQARGFVRSYANFLGLDGEHLASALDADKSGASEVRPLTIAPTAKPSVTPPPAKSVLQPPPQKPLTTAKPPISIPLKSDTPLPGKPAEPLKRSLRTPNLTVKASKPTSSAAPASSGGIPTWAMIVGAIVLFALGAILIISALSSAGQSPVPNQLKNVPDAIGRTLLPDHAERAAAPVTDGPISITVIPGEHVWARITLDGQTAFEGMLDPSMARDWIAQEEIIVETGNAAALTVRQRGQDSVLGARGEIVARAWGHSGPVDVPLAAPSLAVPSITPSSPAPPQATKVVTNTVQ
jgi:cytoskeleton protein RodZ